ncbi:MAG: ComF family protein [Candidatus Goldbacteria bacterium]|nr:ComF family protein [Candidatus Goldiibacteriota bacterium]
MEKHHPLKLNGKFDVGFALIGHSCIRTGSGRTGLAGKLYGFKYQKNKKYLKDLSACVASFIKNDAALNEADCIIPVPASAEKDWQPVSLIAEAVSKTLKKNYAPDVIKKVRKTVELKNAEKNYAKKRKIIKDAFDFLDEKASDYIRGKKVLLIDDVYDTGATADEISVLLKKKGKASFTGFLCIMKIKKDEDCGKKLE